MLIECKYWMASPMLFMISEASAGRWGRGGKARSQDVSLGLKSDTRDPGKMPPPAPLAGLSASPEQAPGALLPRRPAGPATDPFYLVL